VSLHVTQNPLSLKALADDREPLSLQSGCKRKTAISITNAKMFSDLPLPPGITLVVVQTITTFCTFVEESSFFIMPLCPIILYYIIL
jgi:hypothetical protein